MLQGLVVEVVDRPLTRSLNLEGVERPLVVDRVVVDREHVLGGDPGDDRHRPVEGRDTRLDDGVGVAELQGGPVDAALSPVHPVCVPDAPDSVGIRVPGGPVARDDHRLPDRGDHEVEPGSLRELEKPLVLPSGAPGQRGVILGPVVPVVDDLEPTLLGRHLGDHVVLEKIHDFGFAHCRHQTFPVLGFFLGSRAVRVDHA